MNSEESSGEEETRCSLCSTEFSLTTRRHHCRICRLPVCSSCSGNSVPIASIDPSASPGARGRACDRCMEERRNIRTSEVAEQLEAQRRIVETLKSALKNRVDEVEEARKFLAQGIFDSHFRQVGIPLPGETEKTLTNLVHAVEAAISKIDAEIVSVSTACANDRLERVEKERGVVLLGERSARAEDAAERTRSLETRRAELKNKVDYQAYVLDALRDRINYLQRASSGSTSPLFNGSPRRGLCGAVRQRCLQLSN
ncbi:hypothetical protein C9890_0052, partial [Perkinsus sp. BL_2016]